VILVCLSLISFVLSYILNFYDIHISKRNALNSVITWRVDGGASDYAVAISSGFNSLESNRDMELIIKEEFNQSLMQ
jgi:hypothetical protein